jgi:hypothetical protein
MDLSFMQINSLIKVRQLSWKDRGFLLSSVVLLPVAHLALLILGYHRLQAMIDALFRSRRNIKYNAEENLLRRAQEIAYIVFLASEHGIYKPSCLRRSLVVWGFIRSEGIPAKIIFGVRQLNGRLEAHAWVECNDQVVNDAPSVGITYRKLLGDLPRTKVGL